MTYGRVLALDTKRNVDGAVVSHLAELVRGDFFKTAQARPPHPAFGHLLPKGRRAMRGSLEFFTGSFAGAGKHRDDNGSA